MEFNVPNAPFAQMMNAITALQNSMQQLQNTVGQMHNAFGQMQNTVGQMQNTIGQMQTSLRRVEARQENARVGHLNKQELRYNTGVTAYLPKQKEVRFE